MQFRLMGKKIQCIRSVYNKDTKKCDMKIICTIPQSINEITPDTEPLITQLTEQEKNDLATFLHKRFQAAKNQQMLEFHSQAAKALENLGEFIQQNPELITSLWANEIWQATHTLQHILNQNGYFNQPTEEPAITTQKEPTRKGTKSLFSAFHKDIISLIKQGKSINTMVDELKSQHPKQSHIITYNGLRSYIRRNIKK